ncbi:MAG TPA: hypothetical protein VK753_07950 [Xanthomonadaceae bacterium]|nr:hypothetical protein [Xanthomonadaceae bacterium]
MNGGYKQPISLARIGMPLIVAVLGALLAHDDAIAQASSAPHPGESTESADDKVSDAMYRRNQLRLEQWLERSKSPRDWALASQLLEYPEDRSEASPRRGGALLRKAAEAAPDDRLVQWL